MSNNLFLYVYMMYHLVQKWTKLEKPEGAPWPAGRDSHAACCLNYGEEHPQLLISGGVGAENATTLNDAWILDIKSKKWKEVGGDVHMNECVTIQLTESVVQTKSILC